MPTTPPPKQNKSPRGAWGLLVVMLLGFFVFLLSVTLLTVQANKASVKQDAAEALALMESTCQKYEDYRLGILTKDLQALINKASMLSLYTSSLDLSQSWVLSRYADDQYLSGIFVLDGALDATGSVDLSGQDNSALLREILSSSHAEDILAYSKKVFADEIQLDGHTYEYAIVSRRGVPGLIICYTDTTLFQNDRYEISLSNMLDIDALGKTATIVVTDGSYVLSSSEPSLEGLAVRDCPITNVMTSDRMKNDRNLIKLTQDGDTWYGHHDIYQNYYLYVFYPADVVFSGLPLQLTIAAGFYVLVCLLFVVYSQKKKKESLDQIAKEYHLLNAIASIYDINILLQPQENTWEPLLLIAPLDTVLLGIDDAAQMLRVFRETLIAPSDRTSFLQFTDLQTMSDRLRGKPFLGYTFESVTGKWYQALLVPQIRDREEAVTSAMLLIRNVTEEKQRELDYQERLRLSAERADFANAAKTDFLRRMSHDIRTPINGIRGMAEIGLNTTSDSARTEDCFRKILTASDFLLELVNNVLDMSKLEAGEVEATNEPFDLREVLQNAQSIISSQALESGIVFRSDPPTGTHWHLLGSPLNVQRVLQNIMANAVKYNRPGGSVQISCRENAFDGDTATFIFVCADTGIGMSPEFQKHAFDTFAQEHKTALTTYNGTGLGLAIAKKTVDLMGGTLGFVSREGKGTVFTITLPFRVDEAYEKPAHPEQEEDISIEGLQILMAEDNELNMEIATYMLTERGAVVTPAKDGLEALRIFEASEPHHFDIILMDIMMPVMNGLESARAIRALSREDAAAVPIIAVTANAFSDDMQDSQAAGMNAHLSKPLDFDEVAAVIHHYCKS